MLFFTDFNFKIYTTLRTRRYSFMNFAYKSFAFWPLGKRRRHFMLKSFLRLQY